MNRDGSSSCSIYQMVKIKRRFSKKTQGKQRGREVSFIPVDGHQYLKLSLYTLIYPFIM